VVDFTAPYFEPGQASVAYFSAGQGLAVRADDMAIVGRDSLTATVQVGVAQGTTGAEFVRAETPAQVTEYPESDAALQALSAGEVNAVVVDIPVIVNFIKANPGAGIKIVGGPVTEEQYGIAVGKDKPAVLAALDAALEQVRGDGSYDAIFQRWFGAP
jgi:polar amino acid transport system substrate-binding protein